MADEQNPTKVFIPVDPNRTEEETRKLIEKIKQIIGNDNVEVEIVV